MDTIAIKNRYVARARDLGEVTQPMLVCGGAYSNLEALQSLLAAAARHRIPGKRIIHTGDVVAYCADPADTAKLLRDAQVHAIQGNVEESLGVAATDCGCGFEEGSLCDQLSAEWFAFANAAIDDSLRAWMSGLPCHLTFTMASRRVRVVHGAVSAINAFFFASTPTRLFDREFDAGDADVIIAGHSGIPFTRELRGRVWHNSGALGMPANDGTPRVWYSLLKPEDGNITFEHHALVYDHETARNKMIAAGLPAGYAEALASGRWPSQGVLPEAERSATGVPIHPGASSGAIPASAS